MTASSCASAAAGASAKQLALPRWQVGPCGRACTRSVSPSQSVSTEASARRWPDVSPLVHSRPRLRLWNVTQPVSSVTCRDSRDIQPSISTCWLPAFCTTAGNSPPDRASVERDQAMASTSSGRMTHRDALPVQVRLERRDRDVSRMERAGRQRTVHVGLPECLGERSEEHTSELQSLMRISYAVFCLKK